MCLLVFYKDMIIGQSVWVHTMCARARSVCMKKKVRYFFPRLVTYHGELPLLNRLSFPLSMVQRVSLAADDSLGFVAR